MNGILLAVLLNVSAGTSLQETFDRVAGAAWPIPERLNDLDDIAYPYALRPQNAAAHKQKPRIVRNAFIEVVP